MVFEVGLALRLMAVTAVISAWLRFSIVPFLILARAGGLLPILQPFAALYVLILAILGPLLTKESAMIYNLLSKVSRPASTRPTAAHNLALTDEQDPG
jgi:hypothetical protein